MTTTPSPAKSGMEASQSPAAPADERAAFEKWAQGYGYRMEQHKAGGFYYVNNDTNTALRAWQARAALSTASPQGEAVVLHAVVLLARKFTEANDRGDLFSDKLNDECLTDEERSSLDLASNQADEDYNNAKSALFALCRTLERDPKKSPAPAAAPAGEPDQFQSLRDALVAYVKAQGRMLDKWADGDDNVKRDLWTNLHACEEPAREALAAPAGEPVAPNKLADDVPQDT